MMKINDDVGAVMFKQTPLENKQCLFHNNNPRVCFCPEWQRRLQLSLQYHLQYQDILTCVQKSHFCDIHFANKA